MLYTMKRTSTIKRNPIELCGVTVVRRFVIPPKMVCTAGQASRGAQTATSMPAGAWPEHSRRVSVTERAATFGSAHLGSVKGAGEDAGIKSRAGVAALLIPIA